MTTYKCLLCGEDHPIVDGRVEHTVFHHRPVIPPLSPPAERRRWEEQEQND